MSRVVKIVPSTRELPDGISKEQWLAELKIAADAWSSACDNFKLVITAPTDRWSIQEDGQNTVAFRGKSWCKNYRCGRETTYPTRVAAMTSSYAKRGNLPVEADIELNSRFFSYSLATGDGSHSQDVTHAAVPGKSQLPLQAVLVHEFGHLLGLADQCDLGHFPGSRPKSNCQPGAPESAMHAPARLLKPTTSDLDQVCNLFAEVGNSQRHEPASSQTSLAPLHLLGVFAVGAFAVSLWIWKRRTSR